MPCKIEIRKKIEDSVEQLTDSVKGSSLRLANEKAKEVNDSFGAKVVQFDANEGGLERSIFIPGFLIQIYYDNELEIEKQEAARLLKEEEEKERKYVESKKEEWEQNREYFENDEPFTRVSDANTQIQKKLQELYPEINLNITNKPAWENSDNVFNQLIEDDYFEGNSVKYQDEIEKISNLILNKLKFKLKDFNGKYDESVTTLEEYKTKILNDLLKNIGINGVTSLSQLKDKLNSAELQTALKEELQTAKTKKEEYAAQLETFYSTRRLLNNFLKHFDLSKYDDSQQNKIKQYLPSLFKDNKFKSDKQAIAFLKKQINSDKWANKTFNIDKNTLFFLGASAKIGKIETLINYFKIDKQDAIERIYNVVENELNRREKFFTSEKIQGKINAKIVEDKIKSDNEKSERQRRQNEELNKYKNSTVVQEVEGFLGGRNIHDLEAVLESSNINIELATIKNNGHTLDKTPEGKQSDLFVSILNLPEVNGNIEIAKKLKSLVYSEDFTNWFGDWLNNTEESSKIVDENGEPKLVYHGSGREFSNFEEKERGSTTGKWKDRLSDSEMSFMFTDSPNTAFYYAILERQEILKELTYYIRKTAQEPTNELIQEMYKKYPAIKNWVDSLKEKGLTKEEILKEFNRVYQEYNKLRDLSEGGAIGNMQANNEGTKQIIDYLEKNKETILKNGIPKNDKYNTAIIPGSDKNGYPVWLWSSKEYNTITVGNNGILNSFETKSLNGKNIKELSSSEYDLMVKDFKSNFVYNYQKIQEETQAGGFRPKVYPVFLNAKKVNSKDFKNRPFNFQIGDTKEQVEKKETIGAQYEVADLIEEALNNNLDGSIIENIADPTVSTNYAIFRSNQIKSVFNKKDYTSQDNFYNQIRNEKIIGQANIKAMSVLVDAVNKKEDTLPHEYAHHYIAWFRNTPIVQEAIKKWGSEEALVQSIGEQVVKQKGEAYDWWKKFTDYIMDLFNNLSTKDKQELTNILTDAFLSGIDLENNNVGISRERSKELASKASGIFNQEEPIKPGVEELFNENEAFANEVYEALGFKFKPDIINEAFKNEKEVNEAFSDYESTFVYYGDEDMEDSDGNRVNPIDTVELPKEFRRQGLGTLKYILEGEKNLKKGMNMTSDPTKRVSEVADKIWNKLINLGLAEKRNERYYYTGYQITPQQKQQAQQLYSSYLDTVFPNSQVKDIVYHGTIFDFPSFSKKKLGRYTQAPSATQGFFFTNNKLVSDSYIKPERIKEQEWIYNQNKEFVEKYGKLTDISKVDNAIKELKELLEFQNNNTYNLRPNTPEYYSDSEYVIFKDSKDAKFNSYREEVGWKELEPQKTYRRFYDYRSNSYKFEEVSGEKLEILVNKLYKRPTKKDYKFNKNYLESSLSWMEYIKDLYEQGEDLPNLPIKFQWEITENQSYGNRELLNTYIINKYAEIGKTSYRKPSPITKNVILNLENPLIFDYEGEKYRSVSYYDKLKEANNKGNDGAILQNTYDSGFLKEDEYKANVFVVFEPEQIHILGNKQDIEGFKEFVGESTQTVESYRAQEQAELSQRIPNIENYKVNGKVVKSLITDENDLETYNEIYDKYDALITPLLEASEESEEQVENTDSLEELLDNEKLDFQDAILIDLINKVAPNQESLPTTEEVVEELPSQQSIDSQKQNNSYSDLVSTIKGLMNTLGIKIVKAEAIYLKQQEINTLYDKLASSKSDIEKQSIQKQIDELKKEGVRKNVLGLADTLNGVINLALSENNIDESEFALNEEMLHFIVDIIEQKYPDLYKELLQKVGTYNLYNQMYGVYASQKEYQNKDGSVNVNKIKKEAVAKVLNDFLSNPEYSEEDYQLSKTQNLWNKIKDTLKSFFEQKANNVAANNFRFTLDKLLNDPNFITKEDAKLLSGEEFFGIMGTISSWAGNKMIGKESAFAIKNTVSSGEYVKDMLEQKKNVSKTYVDKDTGKITSPTEPNSIERYAVKTLEGIVIVRSRVSDFVAKFLEKIFPNSSSKNNKELELASERGIIVHNIFELTFAKYVDPDTGIVRKQPINSSPQLETYEKKYAKDGELSMPEKIDKYVKELIALYPNSYFLTEIPIFNKSLTVGGTIDLMIVEPNKKVHVYDWKTKKADVHKGQGIIQKREKIDPWNIKAWRIQLDSYMDILKNNYGVESFGKIRMIPIMTEFETNGTTISNINIGSESNPDIRQRQLLAVPSKQELTGLSETDKLIKANYGLAEKLQNKANKVSDISEKERLRLQSSVLEDLAIDLQVGKGIQSLVNKLEQILKIHDDIIEKDRNGEIKGSDLPIIASAIVDLSIYASDSRLINVSEELFSRFSNLTDLQKETKKELENISIKVSSKIEELKKVLINSAEIFGNDQNVYDINKIENEIENSPGILGFSNILAQKNSIYQLNFKTGQLFSNLVRGVQNQIERERSDVRRTLEKIKTDYLKDFGGIFKSDESVFSILFRYPTEQEIKEGAVDGPKLVAKIDKKFYTTLKEQKEKFVNLVNASIKLKKDFTKTAGYTELVKWLEDNTDFEAWRKNYIERKEKQKNLLETQYSYIVDEYERNYTIEQALNSWEYRYNILKSPAALNSNNISAFINEDKWLSADYKKIKSSPSALAAYNAFREIMFNARRVGYIQDLSQISEIPTNITTKNKLAYYYSLVKLHGSLKYLYFNSIPEVLNNMLLKPLESNLALDDIKNGFNNINPVTQEEELELPIYMLRDFNAQVGKDGRLKSLKDLDLFKVYEELAFHVINFQNLSATEELADALIMVEQGKTLEKQMNAQGNTNEKNIKNKETKTREDILKHAKNFIYYNKTKEKDKTTVFNFSRNKLIEYWKAFTASLYLGFNHALAFKAFTASTLSTISNAGYTYSKRDVLFSPLRRALTSSLIEKSFNYHVSSSNLHENRLKNNNYAKRAAVFGKEYLLNSLTVVDYEVQKNIFYAILPNFTIIEENGVKKIVNIDKYVDDKYPDIFKETPEKRKEIFKKKNEEKEKLRKNNLSIQLEEKAKKEAKEGHISLDLSDIDAKSIDSFTNKIQEESKRILGNMSDKDIYLWKTGNLMSLITQFKGFAFKIVDVRYGGIKYNSALERWTYGKYRALGNFLSSNQQIIDENNQEVLKTKLAIGSSIIRFLTIAAPFLNIKENEQIIQVLKIKYLQYATDAKNKNETVMSEKEYMDMYLTELTSAKNELYVLSVFIGLLAFGGGDDDKDDPFWLKYIKNIIKGSQKELLFTASPKQLSSMVVMGFPGLGSLTAVFNAISFQFGNVLEFNDDWTNLFVKVDPFKYTVGERLSPIIKATPFVRPTSALLAQYSADWRKFLDVDKKSRSLVKNRIK